MEDTSILSLLQQETLLGNKLINVIIVYNKLGDM